eukprot:gb/GECH01011664.1/.p1 GENE.gb/GECH01011664.1/~~gb/GECH01011664.1/.p1  ORF type:complete len:351 (+),score=91.52 gb/GECH01011664.1/:1-1053(+)
MKLTAITSLLILALSLGSANAQTQVASCQLQATSNARDGVSGDVKFTSQSSGDVTVDISINGFEADKPRGIHIHSFGDLSKEDGTSLGGHYGDDDQVHALPNESENNSTITRHFGDMGNVQADSNGVVSASKDFSNIDFSGSNSVIGRGVVLHLEDDNGFSEQPSGAAGPRGQVCVIGKTANGVSSVSQQADMSGRIVMSGSNNEMGVLDVVNDDDEGPMVRGYVTGFPEGTHKLKGYQDGDLIDGFTTSTFEQDVVIEDSTKKTCVSFAISGISDFGNVFGSGIAIEPEGGGDPYRAVIGVMNPAQDDAADCEATSSSESGNGSNGAPAFASVSFALLSVVLMIQALLF